MMNLRGLHQTVFFFSYLIDLSVFCIVLFCRFLLLQSNQKTPNECIFIVIIPKKMRVKVEVSLSIFAFHRSLILIMTYYLGLDKQNIAVFWGIFFFSFNKCDHKALMTWAQYYKRE